MQEGYVEVNSIPTHIITWGHWIEDKFDENTKSIVLIIAGNPGLPCFYSTFSKTIYDELDQKVPVWVIGHAGHDEPKKELNIKIPPLEGNESFFDLKGQVNHKVDFIRKFVPEDVKIHVVSHSIGSKITLDLLQNSAISERIHKCYCLFPTIERMMNSSNGFWFFKVFNRFYFLIRLLYHMLYYVPLTIRTLILYAVCTISQIPTFFLGTMVKCSTPEVIDKIWFMAVDEMKSVRDIDEITIKNNLHRLKFYYGTTDGWVPVDYYQDLIRKFPGIDAELCTQKIDHAFVISHGPTVGRMVSDWIRRQSIAM